MQEATFQSSDGLKIFYRSWAAEGPPKAVIVINHGFNSHSGQYIPVAEQFSKAGFAVFALDMRGRGKSEGKRFFVNDVKEHTGDLHHMILLAKADYPELPVFLLGHSAGGVVSATYVLEHQDELAGFVCEDFAFKIPAPDFALAAIKFLGRIFPNLPILKLKMQDFTRDPEAVARLLADPLTKNETQPATTVAALARADDHLKVSFGQITLPLLILHGTADKATMYQGSQFFLDHASSADKTLKLYEGHYHDLLADIGKEQVLADILGWIDAHLK
ncbi:MAG: lysophospholipase [Candidatus Andeanibacterium colombiense]|uniref:Monoacylglycerol lipase n=1 Tax=Candidatus Andeanibacterium colombiense TaxID=3121345 RepID=A0AAJ6BNW6_9SPHN|nr:MAG: lysophospholipase [Sphingomonadaceae bacterium]